MLATYSIRMVIDVIEKYNPEWSETNINVIAFDFVCKDKNQNRYLLVYNGYTANDELKIPSVFFIRKVFVDSYTRQDDCDPETCVWMAEKLQNMLTGGIRYGKLETVTDEEGKEMRVFKDMTKTVAKATEDIKRV